MTDGQTFFGRFWHSLIPQRAAVVLVGLVWSSLALCGEIHDAAQSGDLEKVKALLKANPDLVFSKDTNGWPPLARGGEGGSQRGGGIAAGQ